MQWLQAFPWSRRETNRDRSGTGARGETIVPPKPLKYVMASNTPRGLPMNESTPPLAESEPDVELTTEEVDKVAGGFNPQPDPPGRQ